MKISDIKRVRQAVERGGWIGGIAITGLEGLRLNVRGLGNSDYNRLYAELVSTLPADQCNVDGTPTTAARETILVECLKRTILIGWDGLEDEFTAAAVDDIFADPDLGPAFRSAVLWAATEVARTSRETRDISAKN